MVKVGLGKEGSNHHFVKVRRAPLSWLQWTWLSFRNRKQREVSGSLFPHPSTPTSSSWGVCCFTTSADFLLCSHQNVYEHLLWCYWRNDGCCREPLQTDSNTKGISHWKDCDVRRSLDFICTHHLHWKPFKGLSSGPVWRAEIITVSKNGVIDHFVLRLEKSL